ncbi:PDR/VanB family oxidoreductase [Buttiauxella noackiae]|uniref:PDR/VanB family oxidoreductase n=1 Tax=Buttiauxella noackiae TaxID=82992 RepID=UPI0028D4A9B8|nr:PDR/VanB family oxidoreductase [Buttiauxella noackiae]
MAFKQIEVEVVAVRELTPSIREYQFATPDKTPLPEYTAGAHITLFLDNREGGLFVRHYSLLGGDGISDDARYLYRIAVQREPQGTVSGWIHQHLLPGCRLRVSVPVNAFALERTTQPVLLIAGGIGITPVFSMMRSLMKRHKPFSLLYCGRTAGSMAFHDDISRLIPGRVHFHYSQKAGRIDLHTLLGTLAPETAIYICGPSSLIDGVCAAARERNFPQENLHYECFAPAVMSENQPFEVELKRSGRIIPIASNTSILDALNAAKVDVLWDCRRGECGLCEQAVISADGPLVHQDHYLSEEEKQSGESMCICVSRLRGKRLVLDLQ